MAAQKIARLRLVRIAAGLTLFDVAVKTRLTTSRISHLERAEAQATDGERQVLSALFQVPAEVLFAIETPHTIAAASASPHGPAAG